MMKKPTASQANLDTDSYYSYKGGIAVLALCVCDADMRSHTQMLGLLLVLGTLACILVHG
jgi:hypothetical protein